MVGEIVGVDGRPGNLFALLDDEALPRHAASVPPFAGHLDVTAWARSFLAATSLDNLAVILSSGGEI